jgi:hypothetical protein
MQLTKHYILSTGIGHSMQSKNKNEEDMKNRMPRRYFL